MPRHAGCDRALASRRNDLRTIVKFTDEVEQVHAHQSAEVLKLNEVQPTDATLDGTDPFLWHAPSTGNVSLSQAGLMPRCKQHLAQQVGFGAVEGLGHRARIRGPPHAIFAIVYRRNSSAHSGHHRRDTMKLKSILQGTTRMLPMIGSCVPTKLALRGREVTVKREKFGGTT